MEIKVIGMPQKIVDVALINEEFNILAIHIDTTSNTDFISQVEQLHKAFGLPIWVTERACQVSCFEYSSSHNMFINHLPYRTFPARTNSAPLMRFGVLSKP